MLDIFVVALLASLVRAGALATIVPGRAARLAFGAVVVLTMLASLSFDPRLLVGLTRIDPGIPMMPDADNAAPSPSAAAPARLPALTAPRRKPARWLPSLVWLIPIVAAVVGISLLINTLASRGPEHHGDLPHRRGPDAGQDRRALQGRRYRAGEVRAAGAGPLARGGHHRADQGCRELRRGRRPRFWVVRPRFAISGVSGLGRCCPAPISAWMPASRSAQHAQLHRAGGAARGHHRCLRARQFVLRAQDLGSLDIGSPVYHRRVQVGQVVAYQLEAEQARALRCGCS